jgi:hypothetical protein
VVNFILDVTVASARAGNPTRASADYALTTTVAATAATTTATADDDDASDDVASRSGCDLGARAASGTATSSLIVLHRDEGPGGAPM